MDGKKNREKFKHLLVTGIAHKEKGKQKAKQTKHTRCLTIENSS
jgi:hypothetical protein